MSISDDFPILSFVDSESWREWLTNNHASQPGVWIRLYKQAAQIPSINHSQALDEALCFGWIDSQAKSYDDTSYLQKFTPRRAKSLWSKRNIEHIERLTAAGKMTSAGLREIDAAKADGRWDKAYSSPSNSTVPSDFLVELNKHPVAKAFFATLNRANTYAITWRLETAKTAATRMNRMGKIIAMLNAQEKFH